MNIHIVVPFLLMLLYTSTYYTLSTFTINSQNGRILLQDLTATIPHFHFLFLKESRFEFVTASFASPTWFKIFWLHPHQVSQSCYQEPLGLMFPSWIIPSFCVLSGVYMAKSKESSCFKCLSSCNPTTSEHWRGHSALSILTSAAPGFCGPGRGERFQSSLALAIQAAGFRVT